MAADLDAAAGALLSVWEAARERATSRLSSPQLRAVMVVEQYEGINLRRLAELLGMLLSSASRLCDRLVAAEMLEREPGRSDRREISLHLTPAARALLKELREDRQARLLAVLRGMSPAGRQALLDGLREFESAARADATGEQGGGGGPTGGRWAGSPEEPGGRWVGPAENPPGPPMARSA